MPRKSDRNLNHLSSSARDLVPVTGWPEEITNKTKIMCRCRKCGFETEKSWDMLTNKTVAIHCKLCANAQPVLAKFNSEKETLSVIQYRWNPGKNNANNNVKNNPCAIEYTVNLCAKNHTLTLAHGPMKRLANLPLVRRLTSSLLQCVTCKQVKSVYQPTPVDPELIREAQAVWGKKATLARVTVNTLKLTVPDLAQQFPDGCIPWQAVAKTPSGRIKGAIDATLSEARIRELISDDQELIAQTRELVVKAPDFGAEMRYIFFIPRDNDLYRGSGVPANAPKVKPGILYRYRKATKYVSSWQSYHRILRNNFSRTGIQAEQSWISAAARIMFPKNEAGIETDWTENDRSIIGDNLEIDISTVNLLTHLQGILIEYDGDPSHRTCAETQARDLRKEQEAKGLFLRVPQVKNLNAERAVNALLTALEKAQHPEKTQFLKLLIAQPDYDAIRQEYIELVGENAIRFTRRVQEKIKQIGIKVVKEQRYYLPSDEFNYRCATCESLVKSNAKTFIDSGTKHCQACRGKAIQDNNIKNRENIFANLPVNVRNNVPPEIKHTLVQSGWNSKICCPRCFSEFSLGQSQEKLFRRLEKDNGFLCSFCFNSGEKVADNIYEANLIAQHADKVKEILSYAGVSSDNWWKYTSFDASDSEKKKIIITLTCANNHKNAKNLRQWRGIFSATKNAGKAHYCPSCATNAKQDVTQCKHHQRLRRYHPNAVISDVSNPVHIVAASCGEVTRLGNVSVIHPPFYLSLNKLSAKHKDVANNNYSYCVCCSELSGKPMPGSDKTLAQLTARLQIRAAIYSTAMKLPTALTDVKITSLDGSAVQDKVKSSNKLLFSCCIGERRIVEKNTFNNFFNPTKDGFFKVLMDEAGVKKFEELKAMYNHRPLADTVFDGHGLDDRALDQP
ncbi:MAG: hypothetical protein E7H57_05365 [Pantoea sp.]|nr:hypothetical protein [Pantoea sp.]